MARNHSWNQNTCLKCGLMRERKTRRLLMAITNQKPYDHYKYEQYWEYNDGVKKMEKRPDCRNPESKKCDMCGDPFTGKGHYVVDENHNKQCGLIQCDECFKESIL